jgi:ligand-binding sensor domain-containing protein
MFVYLLIHLLLFSPQQDPADYSLIRGIRFQNINIDQGLSQSAIQTVFQDSRGFLWVGTFDGLDKWDGFTFYHYSTTAENEITIAGKEVTDISEAYSYVLWVTTDNGLTKIDIPNNTSTSYFHDSLNSNSIPRARCNSVLADSKDRVWVATDKGIVRLIQGSETFLRFSTASGEGEEPRQLNLYEFDSRVWSVDVDGIVWVYNEVRASFERFIPEFLAGSQVTAIYYDSSTFWFGCVDNAVIRYSPQTQVLSSFKLQSTFESQITGISEDTLGRVWVCSSDGTIALFDRNTQVFSTVKKPFQSLDLEKDISINNIVVDRSGVIWLGTDGYGLYSYSPYRNKFEIINNSINANIVSKYNFIFEIFKDDNKLWLGSRKGKLEQIDLLTNTTTEVLVDTHGLEYLYPTHTFLKDNLDRLWYFPSFAFGYKVNRATLELEKVETFGSVREIIELSTGEYLTVGNDPEISIYPDSKSLFDPDSREVKPLPFGINVVMLEVSPEEIWIGGNNGLIIWRRDTNNLKIFQQRSDAEAPLPNYKIKDLKLLSNDNVAIATIGGLVIFDAFTETFKSYTTIDGLPNDTIYTIEEDEAGFCGWELIRVWFA